MHVNGCYCCPKRDFLKFLLFYDLLSSLQALIVQLSPKECLISADSENLRRVLERNPLLVTERKKGLIWIGLYAQRYKFATFVFALSLFVFIYLRWWFMYVCSDF